MTSSEIYNYVHNGETPTNCTMLKSAYFSISGEVNNMTSGNPYMPDSNSKELDERSVVFSLDGVEFYHRGTGYHIYIGVCDDSSDNFYEFNKNDSVNQTISNSGSDDILFSKLSNKSILGSDGALYSTSDTNYVKIYNNGHFEVSCGQFGMKISEDGIFFKKNNISGYNISLDSLINQ